MKSLSAKTFQCGVTVQGLTTLSGTVYLTALTNTATWDYVIVGTTAQGQLYTRTYAQLMSDITSGIGLSGYVPTSRTLTINGVSYDLTANRSWTISTVDYTSRLQHQVKAGVAINKGQAVYVTSADGTNMIVGLASNASEATSSKTMGLLDATVSINGFANVVTEGLLAGLDTSTAGTEGDPVWLGTGGNLIYGLINKPYAPAHLVFIGIVTRKNSNNGEIFVKVQNGFELNEIHDVDLKTNLPVNGELLGFNGTLWVNKTIAGWLGYTPANASGTTNYISKFTGSTTLGNSQIYDDGSNVGIGTTTMYGKLSISSGNSNGIRIDTNGGGYSALNIGGTGALTVDAPGITGGRFQITDSGNVGIGTPSPSYKLQVNGDGNGLYVLGANSSPYNQIIATFIYGGNGNSINIENQGGKASIQARAGGSTMDLLLNPVSGNVVIGTTSPFTIGGTAKVSIYADAPSTYGLSSTDAVYLRRYGVGEYQFQTTASGGNSGNLSLQSYGGNVGIGTTTPSQKLDVNGYAKFTSGIILDGGATSHYREFIWNTSGFNRWDLYVHGAEPGSNVGGDLFLARYADNGAYLANAVTFQRSTGNVGIGTSSPGYTLDVNGSSAFRNDMYVFSTSTYWYNGTSYFQATNSSDVGILKMTNNTSPIALQPNGGNVGIGTTSPAGKLQIADDGPNALVLGSTQISTIGETNDGGYPGMKIVPYNSNIHIGISSTNDNKINLWYGGSNYTYWQQLSTYSVISNYSTNALVFQVHGGNVGIGTTSPYSKLEITPSSVAWGEGIVINPASGYSAVYYRLEGAQGSNYTGTWAVGKAFSGDGGGELLQVVKNGLTGSAAYRADASQQWKTNGDSIFGFNVGIGTTSPGNKLHIVGAANGSDAGNIRIDSTDQYGGLVINENATFRTFLGYGNANHIFSNAQSDSTALRAANYLHLGASSVATITINASDNVGIGTTSPSAKLDVNGAQIIQSAAGFGTDGDQAALFLSNTANFGLSGNFSGYSRNLIKSDGGSILTVGRWNTSLISELSIESGSSGLIKFLAGASERMRITSAGNVVINSTSTPYVDDKLYIASGNIILDNNRGYLQYTTGGARATLLALNSSNNLSVGQSNAYNASLLLYGGTGNVTVNAGAIEVARFTTAGNVGIGTTSPAFKLEVNAGSNAGMWLQGSSDVRYHVFSSSSQDWVGYELRSSNVNTFAGGIFRQNTSNNRVSLYNKNTEAISLMDTGNVGIGTTTPSTLLDVSGVITATGGNSTNWNTAYGWGNHASASYVPQARTLTINGTSYDLSANRSWTIATSGNIQQAADNGKVTTAASVGTTVITTVATASYDGATFNYVLKDGTNYRAGTIIAVWSAGAVQFNETTTNDIGSTVGVTFAVALNAGNAELRATSATSGWTVKVVTIGI